MPNGPFPTKEAELNQYFQIVYTYLNIPANTARLLLSSGNKTLLYAHYTSWNANFPLSQNPDTATRTIIDNKNMASKNLQALFRVIFNDIPESVLTIQDRNTLNLPARSNKYTATPVPTTKPVGKADTSKRLEHTIAFVDEATPTSRAKPEGVRACQIWVKIGTPAIDPSELSYVASDTATPYVAHFNGADAGKTAHYWLRWENTRGEVGPWSDVIMATIPG